ncbi:sensor histidine kinase [Salipaludibacillus neizhouensis]|uniref:histidine kinase n=2 Tax=Salipaludibacillus neizhouensis TaxID=885475 RepID=A0A3A9K2D0_9BACI|nr:sensor histidine kinase [Salipaludibacillus neizhouensis]
MFLLISFILMVFSVGGLTILQNAFHVYNQEIYRHSSQSLRISSKSIENELKKMEMISYQVVADISIQKYLGDLKSNSSKYQQFLMGVDIRKRLLDIGALDQYVDSIQAYDLDNEEFASGNKTVMVSRERLDDMAMKTATKLGGVEWFVPSNEDNSLIVGRQIRSYLNFTLKPIGLVFVRIDIEDIIEDFYDNLTQKETQLAIFDENGRQVYPVDTELPSYFLTKIEDSKGYNIIKEDGKDYFITYRPAQHTKWTYMIVTPYSNLFETIHWVKMGVIGLYLVMFIVLVLIGMRVVTGITRPIESLNKKMLRVKTGGFRYSDCDNDTFFMDESGEMHSNFKKMMDQINFLIEENYRKQLVIKDTEFRALQAQINPHFLYNTLEAINWSAKASGHDRISKMADSLGKILQAAVNTKEPMIVLEEELSIVNNYITIQKYRFQERLSVQVDIDSSIKNNMVPKFSLQPIVENSIKYGLQKNIGVCNIAIVGRRLKDKIVITVDDDGPGMDDVFLRNLEEGNYKPKGSGIGLKNIDERIRLLFGEEYGLKVRSKLNEGTKVIISLPYKGGEDHVQSTTSG